jgi:phosphoribosylamine-glycine ligase
MNEIIKPLKTIHEAMAPVYLGCEVDGAISTEFRQGKNKVPHFSDICSRFGNPPAGVITSEYKNFPKIVQGIAHGEVVEPEFRTKFGAELSVDSADCADEPTPFEFDPKDWLSVKLRTACKVEGIFQHIPFKKNGSTIVKVVGLGDTQDEAEEECLKAAENFKCPHKSYNKNSFEELKEMIKEGEKFGLGGTL